MLLDFVYQPGEYRILFKFIAVALFGNVGRLVGAFYV